MSLRATLPLLASALTLSLTHADQTPTVVTAKLTPAYAAGNTDVLHVVHTADSAHAVYVQSDDGTAVGTLYSVPVAGGPPVALLDNVSGAPDSPGFATTPDSSHVVAYNGRTLYSIPVAGGTPVPRIDDLAGFWDLNRDPQDTPYFTISPDGQTIAAIARDPGAQFDPNAIFTVPVTGGAPIKISDGVAVSGWLRFSPDNQTVYFQGVHYETTLPPMFFYQAPADGSVRAEPVAFLDQGGQGPKWPSEGGQHPFLLPDGSAIIYLALPGGQGLANEVRIIDLAARTGRTLAGADASPIADLKFSHDASHLFITRGHVSSWLHSISIPDGTETILVADSNRIRNPTLSPDGSTVVFIAGDRVLAQAPDGGPVTDLTENNLLQLGGFDIVGFTPDSSRVVFLAVVDQAGSPQLFSNTLDNSDLRRLTNPIPTGRYLRFDPVITRDGSHVLYRADLYYPGDDYLFSVPTVGGGSLLLHPAVAPARDVDVVLETPDGTGVTFIADLNHNAVDELFHRPYTADTSFRLSEPGSGDGRLSQFRITPDSQHAVFRAEARSPGVDELFAVNTTGGPAWRLNQDLAISGDVRRDAFEITPDGTHVVYRADADVNTITELYITTVHNRSEPLKLHPDLNENQGITAFAVSPDNVHIALRGDIDNESSHDIYLVKRDGSDLKKINPPLANGRDSGPFFFSPDGAHIAFLSASANEPTRNNALFLYHVATGELQDVLLERDPTVSLPSDPQFSPDGKTLLFHARTSINLTRLFLAPVDSTDLITTNVAPTNDLFSRSSKFTSDGAFLVARDLSFDSLVAVPVDGGPFLPLDSPRARGQFLEVAPHTGHVVAAYGLAPQFTLVSIPIDGSTAKTLHTYDGLRQPYGPVVFSADGRTAIFTIDGVLHLAHLDGPGETGPVAPELELYTSGPTYRLTPGGEEIYLVARPAGSDGPYSLYHFSLEHEQLTRITTAPGFNYQTLTLTPDGRQAVYIADDDTPGVLDLYATRPAVRHTATASAATESTFNGGLVDSAATEAAFGLAFEPVFTGLRFPGLNVDPLTRVHSAHLSLTASRSSGDFRDILVDLHASTDTPPFVHGPGTDVSDRPTSPFGPVVWPVTTWQEDTTYTSPDLSSFFTYLFSSEGWRPNNAAGFTLKGRGGIVDPADVHYAHLVGTTAPQLEITTLGDLGRGPIERLSFPVWASARGLDPDFAADGDLDGVPLLAEYAFGLDPAKADAPPAPVIFFSGAGNGDFAPTVTYTHPPSRTSTDLTLESSTDLHTWTPVAVTKAGANTIGLGEAYVSELAFPDGFLTAQVSLPVVTDQTTTVHFRFRVTSARP